MKFNKSKLSESLSSFWRIVSNRSAWKGFRITYNVVWNLFLITVIIGLVGLSFAGGAGAGYFASLVKDEPIRAYENMKKDIYNYEETTEVYFDDNEYLGTLKTDLVREEVQLDAISDNVINAVIATEDEYFYEHEGVVPKAIFRAVFQEVTNSAVQSGGSTLTQQLIKNQILTNEVSFDRKAKEILLALRLEKFFEKEEIIEAYLNVVSFGRNANGENIAGIQAAAHGIFGVDAKDLSISQAAYIAGIPQNPYTYTPFTNQAEIKDPEYLEYGLERMKTVLSRKYNAEYITQEEYEEALEFDLVASLREPTPSPRDNYPWLTAEIEERAARILAGKLAEQEGYEQADLEKDDELYNYYYTTAFKQLRQNGYRVYSTINKKIFDEFQVIAKEFEYYGYDKVTKEIDPDTGKAIVEPVETGAVLIENKTGKIISFVAGRDHNREQTNHASDSVRPNGSTMKPILDYAPAFENGSLQPGSVMADVPYTWPGSSKHVYNYSGQYDYDGLMSVRHALKMSRNVPAAKAYVNNLNNKPIKYLEKMGFTSLVEEDYSAPSLSLGALTQGVSVEENVNAYATFANEGKFIDGYMIDKITTKDGEVIFEHKIEPVDVFSPQTAYLTVDVMRDVIRSGTATSLNSYLKFGSDWAGKTGTGQDYKDVWFVATNPNVSFGTWMGYDTPKPMDINYKGIGYSQRNILLWAKLMNAAYDIKPDLVDPAESFKMPGGIVRRSYCVISGLLPSDLCQEAGLVASDLYNAKYVPTKVDDSLTKGNYIVVNDKAYQVPDSAPKEFVQNGVMIKKEYLEKNGLSSTSEIEKLLPNNNKWKNLIVTDSKTIKDNGSVPTNVPGVKISGNTLTWQNHGHNDILGYRIYAAENYSKNFKKIGSVAARERNLSMSIGSGASAYYVTAVDVNGSETPFTSKMVVTKGDYQPEKPVEEKTQDPEKPKDNGESTDSDQTNGNGNEKNNEKDKQKNNN